MKFNLLEQKNSIFLIIFYLFAIIVGFVTLQDYGVHIEEKYHRLNGHYWLNYVSKVFNLSELQRITELKINSINDYTLSPVSYYNKYGVIFDLPLAFIEIFLKLENVTDIYYLKHFISYAIFLIGSFFFFNILNKRCNNFYISFIGLVLFITTPRIFGDSFFYKDILFLSFFTINLFFFLQTIENFNYKNLLLFALFTSLSFNLRIFSILIPVIFIFILFMKSFYEKRFYFFLKGFLMYLFFLFIFSFILWPYLWSSPFQNFVDLFTSVKNDLVNYKILYANNFIENTLLPSSYIFNWVFITSPIFQILFFVTGFVFYIIRLINRFFLIKKNLTYNDLWRGRNEEKDFIIFFSFSIIFLFFIVFNAPFYNGWRLVYFFNIFIIYFGIIFVNNLFNIYRKKIKIKILITTIVLISIIYNFKFLINYHPFQSLYFNNFLSNKTINGFEGDYHGLSSKHFFQKILKNDKRDKIKIGVASHTPLQRGLEAFSFDIQNKFEIVGQEYGKADYIYKNNISEVDAKLNKKYEVPKNFSKIYELKINKLTIYEIFKLKD